MAKLPIPFSNPMTYAGHSGVDYPQPQGTPFRASADGVVTWLGHNSAGGYFIWVQYDDIGPKVGYHHMPSHRGCPPVGSRVSEGTVLGYVGSTGRSTGPHLHSEVEGHRSTAGYWKFFDRDRVVATGGGAAGIEDIMNKEQEAKLDRILNRVEKGLTGERIAHAMWTYISSVNGVKFGDMLRSVFNSVRWGSKGNWHHGTLTAVILNQKGGAEIDVEALAEAVSEDLTRVDAEKLAEAIVRKTGEKLAGK